jgi:sterol-4alpha-carboxylate 3-dehydrogenase (decarboxylating)
VDYYDADITSVSAIRQIFDEVKPDVIIHTAALPPTVTSKELLRRVNVEGRGIWWSVLRG